MIIFTIHAYLLSAKARIKSGTSTASAGALTSATNVVLLMDLIQAGTESGFCMHLTREGMCEVKSGLARVLHRAVAHFTAAVATYKNVSWMPRDGVRE